MPSSVAQRGSHPLAPSKSVSRARTRSAGAGMVTIFDVQGRRSVISDPGSYASEGWLDTANTEYVDAHGVQIAPLHYPHLTHTEIFDSVETFYRRFYFRAPKIASICGEMVRDRQMLVRRLREGVEFFRFLRERLRDGGRLLNHCITRPDNRHPGLPARGFINRYVFPEGELTGSGDVVRAMENEGFEVRHQENLREHYARTTAAWCANLAASWDECVADAGLGVARVWGLYLAGSRLSFERNRIQLHQVLASRTGPDGSSGFPLRPSWETERRDGTG